MRVALIVVLLSAVARAEDHAELRKLIDGYRNAAERKACELVLPKRAPVVPDGAALVVLRDESLLWVDPVAGGYRVAQLAFGRRREPTLQIATISVKRFKALVRDLLLIRDASLRPKEGADLDPEDQWLLGKSALRVELVTGATRALLASAVLPTGGSRPYHRLSRFGPAELAFLCDARIRRAITKWALVDTEITAPEKRWLGRKLDDVPESSWRNQRVRLELSLFLLESLAESIAEPRRNEITRAVDAKPLILADLDALPRSDLPSRSWLMAQLKQRYPDAYRARTIQQFEKFAPHAGAHGAQIELVREYWRLTRKRDVAPVLLAIASRKGNQRDARFEAIRLLTTWKLPEDLDATRLGLVSLLVDDWDDVRVRRAAATALGRLGDRRAILVLREQLRRPALKKPVFRGSELRREVYLELYDLRGPIALALAELGATEAIPELEKVLGDGVTPERRAKLRAQISRALAKLR